MPADAKTQSPTGSPITYLLFKGPSESAPSLVPRPRLLRIIRGDKDYAVGSCLPINIVQMLVKVPAPQARSLEGVVKNTDLLFAKTSSDSFDECALFSCERKANVVDALVVPLPACVVHKCILIDSRAKL
jgi:hypothetical protein